MGSSHLLASQSYLDIYQEASTHKSSGKLAQTFDTLDEQEEGDVFDNSEYIDTLEGRLPLAEAARMIAKDSSRHGSLFAADHIRKTRIDCYKRLTIIGLSFLLIFSSSFSVRNALNSLSGDKQLSLLCYGSMFSLLWFGGVCANPLMSRIRPKWALVIATSGFIIYPLSMFHMAYYLTLPASIYAGFCIGLWWSVEAVYIINISSVYSLVSGEMLSHVVSRFNGFVFCFFLSSHVFGNLLSSLLLGDLYSLPEGLNDVIDIIKRDNYSMEETLVTYNYNASSDLSCGLDYYESKTTASPIKHVHVGKRYIYFAVNTLLPILACVLISVCLRTLKVRLVLGTQCGTFAFCTFKIRIIISMLAFVLNKPAYVAQTIIV